MGLGFGIEKKIGIMKHVNNVNFSILLIGIGVFHYVSGKWEYYPPPLQDLVKMWNDLTTVP